MRLLIVEPEYHGHHLALYVRLIVREAQVRGWEVSLLTTDAARTHPSFDLVAGEVDGELAVLKMDTPLPRRGGSTLSLLRAQLSLWRSIHAASKRYDGFREFDIVYFVNFDYFEKWIPIFGLPIRAKATAGMLMNPKFHRDGMNLGPPSRSDGLYELLFRRMLANRSLRRLAVIDERFKEYCVSRGHQNTEKLTVVPDVGEVRHAPSQHQARAVLGIQNDAFVILLYGKVTDRKGIRFLVRALNDKNCCQVIAIVAGAADDQVRHWLASGACAGLIRDRRLIIRDEFHDDESERLVFGAADVVWLGYTGGAYGSSGVLYQAGSAGLPVVAMKEGLIGWLVNKYQVGITVDPLNVAEVAGVIDKLRSEQVLCQRLGQNARGLAARHTGAAFGRSVCDVISSAAP